MNHCRDCGRRISAGRTCAAGEAQLCLLCQNARVMATFRYLSPAAKRWRAAADADRLRAELAALRAEREAR